MESSNSCVQLFYQHYIFIVIKDLGKIRKRKLTQSKVKSFANGKLERYNKQQQSITIQPNCLSEIM